MRKRLGENCLRCVGYGHVGDSNLHLVRFFYNFLGVKKFPLFVIFVQNITTKEYSKITDELIEPYIFEWVSAKRGSISAEHGIGFKKTKYLHFSKSDETPFLAFIQNLTPKMIFLNREYSQVMNLEIGVHSIFCY